MVKKSSHPQDGKSIKTFFLYAAVVFILIAISLTWKAFLIVQQSKYTDTHFTLAVAQNDKVREIIVFNPEDSSMSVLKITDAKIPLSALVQQTAIATDGKISSNNASQELITDDVSETLFRFALRYPTLQKDITIVDIVRLAFYAKNLPPNKQVIKEVSSEQLLEDEELERTLVSFFADGVIATENTSIQIVNAAGVSGIGQRLERVLVRQGANVVSVTTAQKKVRSSQITYFGSETYTLEKVKKILRYPAQKTEKETIADIVITIGEDSKTTMLF